MSHIGLRTTLGVGMSYGCRRYLCGSSPRRSGEVNHSECRVNRDTHCVFDFCSIRPGTPQPCVVIVGGGLAGLSAANRLVQCGISNFRILEATDSPGGRVRTCWLGDTVAEAGWPCIEGASLANPLYTLAAREGLLQGPLHRLEEEAALVATSEGRPVEPRQAASARALFAEMEEAATEPGGSNHSSLGERMRAAADEKIKELPAYERWDVSRALNAYMGTMRARLGEDLDQLSADLLCGQVPLPGGLVGVKGGMTSLLAPLVRNLPAGALVTCKPVQSVLWGTAGPTAPRALVRACDGENYPADYVIVTVPLGVLKEAGEKMFCPQLPAFKMEAVRGLGFGSVNKIFLKFESPFWSEEGGDVLFSWSQKERDEEESWLKGITGMSTLRGSRKVMCLTVSGREAAEMEAQSDAAVVDGCLRLLRRYLGSAFLPRPTEMLRTNWAGSHYSGGYKSYLGRGGGRGLVSSLAAPIPSHCDDVPPLILFAGEHTHPDYLGTAHGSRLSGIREADRVVGLTKKFAGPPYKTPTCVPCS